MTRRRRLRRRLIWAGVLLGLAVLLASVSVLRFAIWTGHQVASLTRPIRRENAMFRRTSLAIVAALGALLLAAPASADNPSPDWLERFAAAHSLREPLVDDRFRIDPTNTGAPVADSSAREIERPQIGVALAVGLLFGLGLVLAVRITDSRIPVARRQRSVA